MICKRAGLFRGRHFTDEIIVLCVRWYLRYSLSYRDLTEIMCERNLSIDPSTIWRWVQRYAPELNERIRRELKPTNGSWRTDETYVRVAGRWTYLYRAVDSTGATIDFFLSETRDVMRRYLGQRARLLWIRSSFSLLLLGIVGLGYGRQRIRRVVIAATFVYLEPAQP